MKILGSEINMPKRVLQGVVISNKADKTISVLVERRIMHPVYKKYITKKNKYTADSGKHVCSLGDKVKIISTRPLSKTKRWRVMEILEKGIVS